MLRRTRAAVKELEAATQVVVGLAAGRRAVDNRVEAILAANNPVETNPVISRATSRAGTMAAVSPAVTSPMTISQAAATAVVTMGAEADRARTAIPVAIMVVDIMVGDTVTTEAKAAVATRVIMAGAAIMADVMITAAVMAVATADISLH